jgi:hypothetical protein
VLRKVLTVLTAAVLATLSIAPSVALADGDPASDVLLGQDVFYPYSPATAKATANQLNALTTAARKAGFPIKVALIASPIDLGVVPDLFKQPQKYADFLVQEISFQGKQHLLVVMPNGYGTQGLPAAASSAVAALPKPSGATSNSLAEAAIAAVPKIAAAAGHPISSSASGSSSSGGSSTAVILVIVLAVVAVGASAGVLVLRRREQTSQ